MLSTIAAHHMAPVARGSRVRVGVVGLGSSMWTAAVSYLCPNDAFGITTQHETTKRPARRLRKRPT